MPRYGKYPLGRVAVRRRSFVICTLCVTFCGVTGAFAQTDTETPTATSANLDSEQQVLRIPPDDQFLFCFD